MAKARASAKHEVAPSMLLVRFDMLAPAELTFRAGQFISVLLDAEGREKRAYSIASSPRHRRTFELLVKLVPGGAASAMFAGLVLGDEVQFAGPAGLFLCEPRHPGDALFAATGSGIAAAL